MESWLNAMDLMREHARKASFEYLASRGSAHCIFVQSYPVYIASSYLTSDVLRDIVSLPITQVNSIIDAILGGGG